MIFWIGCVLFFANLIFFRNCSLTKLLFVLLSLCVNCLRVGSNTSVILDLQLLLFEAFFLRSCFSRFLLVKPSPPPNVPRTREGATSARKLGGVGDGCARVCGYMGEVCSCCRFRPPLLISSLPLLSSKQLTNVRFEWEWIGKRKNLVPTRRPRDELPAGYPGQSGASGFPRASQTSSRDWKSAMTARGRTPDGSRSPRRGGGAGSNLNQQPAPLPLPLLQMSKAWAGLGK